VSILNRVFRRWPGWRWPWSGSNAKETTPPGDGGAHHLALARESLRDLVEDPRLPPGIRESLASDYAAVRAMLEKLEHGHLHIAVFGRVGTGKSSLLNALIGERRFSVSPLHGETRASHMEPWEVEAGGVFLIDTPGLDEAGGEEREALAKEVAGRADLVIFVVDGDMTESERDALKALLARGRPVVIALNKSDQYTAGERDALLASIRRKAAGLVQPSDVIAVAADPRPQTAVELDDSRAEVGRSGPGAPDVGRLRARRGGVFGAGGRTRGG